MTKMIPFPDVFKCKSSETSRTDKLDANCRKHKFLFTIPHIVYYTIP